MPEISDWGKGPFAALGAGVSFSKGDYEKGVQQIVNSAGFAAFAVGRYSTRFAKKETREAFQVETKILWYGILYCMALQMLYLNATDSGKEYSSAQKNWKDANTSLEDATPEAWGGWTGKGADAYTKQNAAQMARTTTMTGIDQDVFELLAEESKQVKRTYMNIGWEQTTLTCMIPMCSMIYKTQPELSLAIQGAAVLCGVGASVGWVLHDQGTSGENARTLQGYLDDYSDVGDSATTALGELTTGFTATGTVALGIESTVGDFGSLSTAAPLAAESLSVDAEIAAVPEESTTSEDQGAPLSASTASAESGASAADDSEDEASGTTGYTMPTASQVMSRASQASTQAAKFSQQASTHVGLVNQTLGTVQQLASTGQSGAAAPAEEVSKEAVAEEGVLAQDVEGAGAAPAERAPIGVGVGSGEQAEQPQQPSPVERVL